MSILEKVKQYGREDIAIQQFLYDVDDGKAPSKKLCKAVAQMLVKYQAHRPVIDGWDVHEYRRVAMFVAVEMRRSEDGLPVSEAIEEGLATYPEEDIRRMKRWYAKGEYRESKEEAQRLVREIAESDRAETYAWAIGLMTMVESGAITLE